MPQASVGPHTFEFETSGDGEPAVLIHGALIAGAFRPLFSQPALAGYRLIAYHRRGYHGSSSHSGRISIAQQAADCHGLMQSLGIERAHVVGHSFGGAVALQLALEVPQAVQSLALLEPALMIGASAAGYRSSLQQAIRHFHDIGAQTAVHEMLEARWPGYRDRLAAVLPGALEAAVADASAAFDTELPGLLDWSFSETEANRVNQPVLSVLGTESTALSPRFEEVHAWLQTNLNAEAYVLPAAHHFLQIENPAAMAGALAAFFARHPLPA
jgi:pimeloyl-ACP methyl ester carboxylesterase